ncbi:L-asparaginase-like protein [Dinothrombium tinctorium]|uniref:L-asparaginase-like protein n=1 Tax=Dinothrombium tinctorium TaxID=1965070 RepID=A0A3S3S669_9ACAR|nr:L-asparaginase-like protein [Dinothrombium tinctorium]RWS10960.1 L-asparaginase-like protein [Dinothrombium tinctorium]RWS16039.1 L-asparaginase-like protein [Dinothrombium tinctorium]
MPVIVVHGGAANVELTEKNFKLEGVVDACRNGYLLMKNGKTAVDAVEAAVKTMEDDPCFNAGYGSVLTIDGNVEMDALLIDGKTMKAGAVATVSRLKNPVSVARLVMEKSQHCLFSGKGAEKFAQEHSIDLVDPNTLIYEKSVERLNKYKSFNVGVKVELENKNENGHAKISEGKCDKLKNGEHDTVGAVAVDDYGNVACATSTGGLTGKQTGRVGDTPCIGSGGWADNETVAVSTTGHGEMIMRVCLAKHIANLVSQKVPVQEATEKALEYMKKRVNGFGGAIAVDVNGGIGIYYTTECMAYAYIKNDDTICYGTKMDDQKTVSI